MNLHSFNSVFIRIIHVDEPNNSHSVLRYKDRERDLGRRLARTIYMRVGYAFESRFSAGTI